MELGVHMGDMQHAGAFSVHPQEVLISVDEQSHASSGQPECQSTKLRIGCSMASPWILWLTAAGWQLLVS